ncbi:MAG: CAP domain-containing protein, partial [Patescibacteria group bacterium]
DSGSIFKNYFIPCNANNNKPKILQPKALLTIVILLAVLKVAVTGYLFFLYPNEAKMQEKITVNILELINHDRLENNLLPLTLNTDLSAAALAKADDMIINDYFAHYSPNGNKPWGWINRDNYPYLYVGENLAMNFSGPESAHTALMASPSHKKNILNGKYNDIGLAITTGEINGQNTNVLVEMFGSQNVFATLAKTAEEPKKEIIDSHLPISQEVNVLATENETETVEEKRAEEIVSLINKNLVSETTQPVPEVKAMNIEKNANISPNIELEKNPNPLPFYLAMINKKEMGLTTRLITISQYTYLAVLAFIMLALLVNILIRATVQHKSVIIQSLLVIIFISSLIYFKFHFLESMVTKIAVL